MTNIDSNYFSVTPQIKFTSKKNVNKITLTLTDWLILSFIDGVGPARLDRLKQYVDTINQMDETYFSYQNSTGNDESFSSLELNEDLFLKLKWPKKAAQNAAFYFVKGLIEDSTRYKLDETLLWLQEESHYLLSKDDNLYPESLRQIPVAPMLIYVKGNIDALRQPKIGMVGARRCSAYGRDSAFHFARELSTLGFTIVSGGALGIDSSSHMGALSVNLPTIAVMGAGLNNLYPKINLRMYDDLLEKRGAIISEYPINTTVKAHLFPPRNRIISGLSLGVFVVEATIKSGSLISAQYAVQHNREVFALPGRITDNQSSGSLMLIQQGAKLVANVEDIIMELPCNHDFAFNEMNNVSREIVSNTVKVLVPWKELRMTEASKVVIEYIDLRIREDKKKDCFEFDELINNLSISASELSQTLIELELLEIIRSVGTGYIRSYEA